ncbi:MULTISPECIES: adenylyl-sulfate kinase [unclassified Colwellia]|jgi:adenylylsulfate kinase|uniref:adenylyl-sulfate kinase n=1 Tax=unclassified Colwellia TaxID=196834 RepID=UPI0015F6F7B2|nr:MULTISPECIES: adenylyl-sulfate kinase [unclassified Colwellia]MBA6252597.1 adenylyl-sulfate kinase [Colwellia sp. MB3u-55]MBA6397177.1 adenylyl-sulfate kinase [Colwellia sp. BRX10-4]
MKKNNPASPYIEKNNTEKSSDVVWHQQSVTAEQKSQLKGHKAALLWYTGLSGSGKSTVANAVEQKLLERGCHSYLLDGDNVRHGLNNDLGFTDEDRIENIRRIGEVAKLFVDAGLLVSTAFISPFQKDRDQARGLLKDTLFLEVFIDTPLDVCENRDPKGLYKKARAGEIANFTGISSAYEAPENAEIHIETAHLSIEQCADLVINALIEKQIIKS